MNTWAQIAWETALKSTPESSAIQNIQAAFMQFDRRAEKVSQEILAKTFVDAEPLFIQLSSRNHQVFYGRRGTGKTHALKYLAESIRARQEKPIYVDLRSVGSNGSIYSDGQRSLAERASRLIVDVLEAVEQELMQIAVEQIDSSPDPAQITLRLDDLSAAIRSVAVRGPVEEERAVVLVAGLIEGPERGKRVDRVPVGIARPHQVAAA